eukprot:m.399594 g.399594  ORF g.399594 m.399594 type:complete len:195 (-) comp20113_c1_seq28:684-1268(-)
MPSLPMVPSLLATTLQPKATSCNHFFRNRFMSFQHLACDARHIAAGYLLIRQAEETRVDLCFFRGYRESGILSELVGNELFVQSSWFMELDDYTQCHNVSAKSGTGVVLDNNDHSLDNIVIYCSNRGMVLSGAATVVRNLHVYIEGDELYPGGAAVVNATSIRLDSCYFDGEQEETTTRSAASLVLTRLFVCRS